MSKWSAFLAPAAAILVACSPSATPGVSPALSPTVSPVVSPTGSPSGSFAPLADVLTYKGNAARTGEHPGRGPASAPASIWRVEHGSLFRAAPLIAGGEVVVVAEDGTILILDAASGAARDAKVADGFRATGSIADGILYVTGLGGNLWSVSLSDGDAGWHVDGVHEESFVTLADDLLVVGAQDELLAYGRSSGVEVWRLAIAGAERSALGQGVLYAGGRGSGLLTAVGLDGVERWQFDTGADEVLTPAVAGDAVYVATRGAAADDSTVTALDLDGTKLWTVEFQGTIGSHGVDGSRVYVTIQEDPSALIALDPATGTTAWEHEFDGRIVSVLAIARGRVYVVSQAEGLSAIDAASGDVEWQVEVGSIARAGIAISGEFAFVATEDLDGRGRVLAFR